jgi:5'-3' exonuclease
VKQAHLIDISAVFFRYYFAPGPSVVNDEGWEVYPLLASLRWLMNPDFFDASLTVAAFDESLGTCFRHDLDCEYKANRALPTEDIIYQLSLLKSFCEHMGFVVLASDEFEADDFIAASVEQLNDYQIIIHSRDKDLRQLLAPNVIMQDSATGSVWDEERLMEELGLKACQIVDFLSLVGDASDNIAGVPSVGVKTATVLLQQYSDFQGIYQAIESAEVLPVRGAARIRNALIENKDRVLLNQQLTRLRQDIPLSLAPLEFNQDNYLFIHALTQELGIHRPLKNALETLAGLYL